MKKMIFFGIILCIIISLLVFTYYKFEYKTEKDYANLTISAQEQDKFIKTGYKIEYDGFKKEGETIFGELLEKIPLNNTIKIYNSNLENQNYYTDLKTLETTKQINYRVRFDLKKPEPIQVNILKDNGEQIELQLISKDYRNVLFCLKWSVSPFVYVKSDKEKIDKPSLYSNYDKCYDANFSINDKNYLNISYKTFGEIKENDYLNISIIDQDFRGQLVSEQNGQDLGGVDKIVKIK